MLCSMSCLLRGFFASLFFWSILLAQEQTLQPTPTKTPSSFGPDQSSQATSTNTKPNVAKIHAYGRIEWHGRTATLVAAGGRPMEMAALTLSTCLGISVNAEDPEYLYLGDLLDVTAPQWAALHPDRPAYAIKPGKVELVFDVDTTGSPVDIRKLLQDAVAQINQQQPYEFEVRASVDRDRKFYSLVPTRTHDAAGDLVNCLPYLDRRISLPAQTAIAPKFYGALGTKLTEATGLRFDCCQSWMLERGPWPDPPISYRANDLPARQILEDLMARSEGSSV
jgi:hypothetical protein